MTLTPKTVSDYDDIVLNLVITTEGYKTNPILTIVPVNLPRLGWGFNIETNASLRQEVLRVMGFQIYIDDPTRLSSIEHEREEYYMTEIASVISGSTDTTALQTSLHGLMLARSTDSAYSPAAIVDLSRTTFAFVDDNEQKQVF